VRLLLDTHILLWWLADDPALSPRARTLISDPRNQVFVSPISLWEIAIKTQIGKLHGDVGGIQVAALADGFVPLPFNLDHAAAIAALPMHHRDPFDRALLAQALCEPLYLLTHDQILRAYGQAVLLV
jgi:PIN domain nuclease of toxin-antitoxin system